MSLSSPLVVEWGRNGSPVGTNVGESCGGELTAVCRGYRSGEIREIPHKFAQPDVLGAGGAKFVDLGERRCCSGRCVASQGVQWDGALPFFDFERDVDWRMSFSNGAGEKFSLSEPARSMKRILIIGYGNRTREDDGIGRLAADELVGVLNDPRVTVIACQELGPELERAISEADCVLFIGAAEYGCPGVVSLSRVHPSNAVAKFPFGRMGPSALLTACQSRYGNVPEAMGLTVSGEWFNSGKRLSPAVAEALPLVVERVRVLVDRECRAETMQECVESEGKGNSSAGGEDSDRSASAAGVISSRPRSAAD